MFAFLSAKPVAVLGAALVCAAFTGKATLNKPRF